MLCFLKINLKIFLAIFFFLYIEGIAAQKESPEPLNFSYEDFTVIKTEDEKKQDAPSQEITPPASPVPSSVNVEQNAGKSYLDEFFDKSLQTFEDVKRTGSKLIEDLSKQREATTPKITPKEDLAKKFPDPFFYDAVYNKNNTFITYAYVYNDKTNRDNSYIPKIYNYKIEDELLLLARSRNDRNKFYELFNASREDKNFNLNYTDKFGNTILLTALRNGNLEIFYFLLAQSANPNVCNKRGICPIHIAVHAFNVDLVKALCRENVDIKTQDINGVTPLQFVIFNDAEDVFDILLARYLRYPINKSERDDLLEFANEGNFVKYYKKMKRAF